MLATQAAGLTAAVITFSMLFRGDGLIWFCVLFLTGLFGPSLIVGYLISVFFPPSRFIEIPQHVCKKCGYDLRATAHRCPECGTVPNGVGNVP